MGGNLVHIREQIEPWMRDHRDSMACLDLEEFIFVGINLNRMLIDWEDRYRLRVFEKQEDHNPDVDAMFDYLFKGWLDRAIQVETEIGRFEAKGYHVEGAEEFQQLTAETRAMLTPDDEFFRGEKLKSLETQAIEDNRNGLCVEGLDETLEDADD